MSPHFTPLEEIVGWFAEQGEWDELRVADTLFLAREARDRFAHLSREPGPGESGTCVYVIHDRRGYVKVGISNRPEARVQELSAGNPEGLAVVFRTARYSRGYAAAVEAAVHDDLAAVRMGREWFDCDADRAVRSIYLMGGEGDLP